MIRVEKYLVGLKISYPIILLFVLSLPVNVFSQDTLVIQGFAFSCQLKKHLTLADLVITNNTGDTLRTKSDEIGKFKFIGLSDREPYRITLSYPYHQQKTIEIKPYSDTLISFCIPLLDEEEIRNDTSTILINHEYGFMPYGELIQNHGRIYGVNWRFHGCVPETNYNYHNTQNAELLKIRNGVGWETQFWDEVEQLYKEARKKRRKIRHRR